MDSERQAQIDGRFHTERLKRAIRFASAGARILGILMLILGFGSLLPLGQAETSDQDWSELIASMDKMHMTMDAVKESGNSDIDFVRLMLPHHQAAIDMAKTQLLYGKDPQMRRLAQEIITDQQLEIELMQRWLQQQQTN